MRLLVAAVIDGLATLPFLLWLFVVAVRRARGERITSLVHAVLWAIAVSYVFAHVNRWFDLWKAHPYFPSGHETFASCMGTALVLIDRRWALLVLPSLALLGYGLVRVGWHGRLEVVVGFLLGTVVMATARAALRPSIAATSSSPRRSPEGASRRRPL